MTKVKFEILDNTGIDCNYYGYNYLVRPIQMSKPNGDLKKIFSKLEQQTNNAVTLADQYQKAISTVSKIKQEIKSTKQKITTSKRKLTNAKKAVKKLQTDFNPNSLNDPSIDINKNKLMSLAQQLKQAETLLDQVTAKKEKYEDDKNPIYTIINDLMINKINPSQIKLNVVLNTALGATLLYDTLIDDGWTVDPNDTINHIVDEAGYTNGEFIIKTPNKLDVYNSKHQ